MKIGDLDIDISAETSLEMLIVLSYYCAYDGSEAEANQVRPLLLTQIEQCSDETLKNQALFALSLLSKGPIENVGLSKFDHSSVQEQITLLAQTAYTSERFSHCAQYDEIKKINDHLNLRIFDHEPESVHDDDDDDNFDVVYGNPTVDLSNMDLLNLILVDRYLFTNVPLGLGPDTTLNITAELERRSTCGDVIAAAILSWSELYFYREH
jgi:hypothetical protein